MWRRWYSVPLPGYPYRIPHTPWDFTLVQGARHGLPRRDDIRSLRDWARKVDGVREVRYSKGRRI